MKLILIGTDHRLQQSVRKDSSQDRWVPREARRFRRLITYCLEKLEVKGVLEECHPKQEETAPTICSTLARARGITYETLGFGEPTISDGLLDPPFEEMIRTGVKSELLAGRYDLDVHGERESMMYSVVMKACQTHDCVLTVLGYIHLGVIARKFEAEGVAVQAYVFTYPLTVDESKA